MWIQVVGTTNKWVWQHESEIWRHQLMHGSGIFAELHGQFLHKYSDQGLPIDPEWPLNNAWPYSTEKLVDPVVTDEAGWQILVTTIAAGLL